MSNGKFVVTNLASWNLTMCGKVCKNMYEFTYKVGSKTKKHQVSSTEEAYAWLEANAVNAEQFYHKGEQNATR